jgi:hypothetical protein
MDSITLRNKDLVVLRPRGLQQATSAAFSKKMLRPSDVDQETFLGQDLSDPLTMMRAGSAHVAECDYVVDFASIFVICRSICNTAEASKEPLHKRVKRVAGHFPRDLPPASRMKAEEFFHGSKIGSLHVLSENLVPYSSFVENGQSFLEDIVFDLVMMPPEMPRQY